MPRKKVTDADSVAASIIKIVSSKRVYPEPTPASMINTFRHRLDTLQIEADEAVAKGHEDTETAKRIKAYAGGVKHTLKYLRAALDSNDVAAIAQHSFNLGTWVSGLHVAPYYQDIRQAVEPRTLTVSEAAARYIQLAAPELKESAALSLISRACDSGKILSAGKGKTRLINSLSLDSFILAKRERDLNDYEDE